MTNRKNSVLACLPIKAYMLLKEHLLMQRKGRVNR
jgi:hypothetical protein